MGRGLLILLLIAAVCCAIAVALLLVLALASYRMAQPLLRLLRQIYGEDIDTENGAKNRH